MKRDTAGSGWLAAPDVEVHVVQPSSVPVERRKRRAKSDKIDADLLLKILLAWLRGEPRVCSMVAICDVTLGEDASRIRVNPGIMARLRSQALNIVRANGAANIAAALWKAAIDPAVSLSYAGL